MLNIIFDIARFALSLRSEMCPEMYFIHESDASFHLQGFFEIRPTFVCLQIQVSPPLTASDEKQSLEISPHNELLYVDPQITESEFAKKLMRKYSIGGKMLF